MDDKVYTLWATASEYGLSLNESQSFTGHFL